MAGLPSRVVRPLPRPHAQRADVLLLGLHVLAHLPRGLRRFARIGATRPFPLSGSIQPMPDRLKECHMRFVTYNQCQDGSSAVVTHDPSVNKSCLAGQRAGAAAVICRHGRRAMQLPPATRRGQRGKDMGRTQAHRRRGRHRITSSARGRYLQGCRNVIRPRSPRRAGRNRGVFLRSRWRSLRPLDTWIWLLEQAYPVEMATPFSPVRDVHSGAGSESGEKRVSASTRQGVRLGYRCRQATGWDSV